LDEPTLGLDLVYRKEFYSQLIEDYFDGNKTIIISTHQVEEIEGVLSDVVFLNRGNVVMQESTANLDKRFLELRPNADNEEKAKALNPLHVRTELGRTVFLYENMDKDKLSSLGNVRPPSIADLFIATMQNTSSEGEVL
jgi:ABC-2 type transport system ATP-binding protein